MDIGNDFGATQPNLDSAINIMTKRVSAIDDCRRNTRKWKAAVLLALDGIEDVLRLAEEMIEELDRKWSA